MNRWLVHLVVEHRLGFRKVVSDPIEESSGRGGTLTGGVGDAPYPPDQLFEFVVCGDHQVLVDLLFKRAGAAATIDAPVVSIGAVLVGVLALVAGLTFYWRSRSN